MPQMRRLHTGPVSPVRGTSYGDRNRAPRQPTTKITVASIRDPVAVTARSCPSPAVEGPDHRRRGFRLRHDFGRVKGVAPDRPMRSPQSRMLLAAAGDAKIVAMTAIDRVPEPPAGDEWTILRPFPAPTSALRSSVLPNKVVRW